MIVLYCTAGEHRKGKAGVRTATTALCRGEVLHRQVPHRQLWWQRLYSEVFGQACETAKSCLAAAFPSAIIFDQLATFSGEEEDIVFEELLSSGWVANLGNRVTPFTTRQLPTAMWRQHWWTSLKVQAAKIRCRLQRSRPRALLPGSRSKPRRLQHLDGSSVTDDGYTWLWRARPVLETTVANAACRLAGGVLEATGGAPTKQVTVS